MFSDLRHAFRILLHARSWTAIVLASLALGIGANTALFTALNGLLLKELSVEDPRTLVRLRWAGRNDMVTSSSDYGFSNKDAAGLDVRTTFSYPMFQQFIAANETMTELFACAPMGRVNVVVDGEAEVASAFVASGNYYGVLGARARAGRTILPEDDRPDAPPVAVISSRYWHSRFGSDPTTVGRIVRINGVAVTVVGVMSPDFIGVQRAAAEPPDVSIPLSLDAQLNPGESRLSQPTYWWLQVMGRLKRGATPAQVQGNLEGMFRHAARTGLDAYLGSLSESARSTAVNRNRSEVPHLRVDSGSRGIYDASSTDLRAVTILTVVVALVLLIVCANVANLLLSRAMVRRKELSVRLALGATRGRLVRQLLTESLLLATLGGALGLLVGYWGRQLLPGATGQAAALDWRVLVFVTTVTAVTGILFGVAPALRATGVGLSASLKENSRSIAGGRSLLGRSLLVIQVAISLVLVVGAGLFLRTVHNLRQVDVGFNPRNLLLFRVSPQLSQYDDARTLALYGNMIEHLEAVPAVRGVAMSQPALLSGSVNSTSIFVQGREYPPGQSDGIHRLVISPGFLAVMEIPLVAGRAFTGRDDRSAPRVVMINEAAARKYFPNGGAVGQRFGSSMETSGELEIVGIVRDTKYNSVRDAAPPTMYVPYLQARPGGAVFEVRTATDPAAVMSAVREAVRQIDPNLPLMDVSTQIEQVERRFSQEKLFAHACVLFGGLALLVASVGLFGLMSYNVARRTNEIGIRMALGAPPGSVLRLVMTESLLLVIAGLVIGALIALSASGYIEAQLFGLAPTDASTMLAAVAVMLLVSAVAGYVPARRASRVDPTVALRAE